LLPEGNPISKQDAWVLVYLRVLVSANRRTAIDDMIEADPVAWAGSAADFLRAYDFAGDEVGREAPVGQKRR